MSDEKEIVVFKYYDTAIEANIAKTKLDAYGIPCFLTEENISNLYPATTIVGFKTRLHLFSSDVERAGQVLTDIDLIGDSDSSVQCPKCGSHRIIRDFPKQSSESWTYIFFGVLMPQKKVHRCSDCDHEF